MKEDLANYKGDDGATKERTSCAEPHNPENNSPIPFEYWTEAPGGSTPHQYGLPEGASELQDLIEHRDMNFAMGNIFKACYRTGVCDHSSQTRDLRKIIWFAERELHRLDG